MRSPKFCPHRAYILVVGIDSKEKNVSQDDGQEKSTLVVFF